MMRCVFPSAMSTCVSELPSARASPVRREYRNPIQCNAFGGAGGVIRQPTTSVRPVDVFTRSSPATKANADAYLVLKFGR